MTTVARALAERAVVVLKDTTHPGNIGAAARAMKTCGVARLVLVSPRTRADSQTRAMAAGAAEIAEGAAAADSLESAVADCAAVFAYTARRRELSPSRLYSAQAGEQAAEVIRKGGRVALVFGGEKSGLENAAVRASTCAVEIPANPCYSSLNLAQAVQIACYDLRRALVSAPFFAEESEEMPTQQHLAALRAHAAEMLAAAQMPKRGNGMLLLPRLNRLILRARPSAGEVRLLRGLLKALINKMR